jgi:hypothetical protein
MSLLQRLDRLASRSWFSYLMLLLLQMKVLWGVWHARDLIPADESIYFSAAHLWFKGHSVNIVWSPLYTVFYGTLLHLSTHAYVVTIGHRVLVVLILDCLILALMRRLLPHWIAWLVAAWWAVLPINFDAVLTVHLFAIIPVLACWLVILYKPSPWTRGGALAVMVLTTILVRNEYVPATLTLAIACLWWELRMARKGEGGPRPRSWSYLLSYGLPLLLSAAIVVFFYERSVYQYPLVVVLSEQKHTANMCQAYAFGYQQRHPEWTKSPWLECSDVMARDFGKPSPSLVGMIRGNPRAVLTHVAWNIGLTPSGIQALMFNATSGTVDPDYAATKLRSSRALGLSLLMIGVLLSGLYLLYRERYDWWEHWLRARALGWLAMLSVIPVSMLIIATQRPRPAYLFTLGLVVMAITGMCVFVLGRRWRMLEPAAKALPIAMVVSLVLAPSHYHSYGGGRPLLTQYERLAPFQTVFGRPDSVFLVNRYPIEVYGYVAHDYLADPYRNRDYRVLEDVSDSMPLAGVLEREGITLFYVDEELYRKLDAAPASRPFVRSPESAGWRTLISQTTEAGTWMLLQKK